MGEEELRETLEREDAVHAVADLLQALRPPPAHLGHTGGEDEVTTLPVAHLHLITDPP